MTTIAMHEPPRWTRILDEQLRLVGLRTRAAGALLGGVLITIGAGSIEMARRAHEANVQYRIRSEVNFTFSPQLSVVLVGIALLLPLMAWQDEDPTRRLYHWAMPVSRTLHSATRVLAGWLLLMASVSAFLLGMVAVKAITERIMGIPQRYDAGFVWWEWLVPYTSTTIAYVVASAATLATRRPFVWIAGLPLLYMSVIGLLHALYVGPSRDIARAMTTVVSGYYGAGAALAGQVESLDVVRKLTYPSAGRWLGATALWSLAAGALLYASARSRHD